MSAQERLRSFVRLTKDIGFDHALQYNDLAADIELGQLIRDQLGTHAANQLRAALTVTVTVTESDTESDREGNS